MQSDQERRGPSMITLFVILGLGMLLAGGLAYWMIYPFFHRATP